VAESNRPPVAIRIVRPYASEDEFLDAELETVGKTSVILIGAHPRPTGVILRFEVTLNNGSTILRGEGRVLAHKDNAFRGQPGLSLRFTRLDPRSKALVDRAAALREAKASGSMPPSSRAVPSVRPSSPAVPPSVHPPVSDPAITDALTQSTPSPARTSSPPAPRAPDDSIGVQVPPPSSYEDAPTHVETRTDPPLQHAATDAPPMHAATEAPAPLRTEMPEGAATDPPPVPSAPPRTPSGSIAPPPDRDAVLARLRERARSLPQDKVDAILASRR
jgi:hypothetical protein